MRFIVITYDKEHVKVERLEPEATIVQKGTGVEVLCEGSSFGDVVKALEQAFGEEMKS